MPYNFGQKKRTFGRTLRNALSRGISPHFALICLQILRNNALAIAGNSKCCPKMLFKYTFFYPITLTISKYKKILL